MPCGLFGALVLTAISLEVMQFAVVPTESHRSEDLASYRPQTRLPSAPPTTRPSAIAKRRACHRNPSPVHVVREVLPFVRRHASTSRLAGAITRRLWWRPSQRRPTSSTRIRACVCSHRSSGMSWCSRRRRVCGATARTTSCSGILRRPPPPCCTPIPIGCISWASRRARFLTFHMLCAQADAITSIAPSSGNGCFGPSGTPPAERPVLYVQGTADNIQPWSLFGPPVRDAILSTWSFGAPAQIGAGAGHVANRWTTSAGTVFEF